MDRNLTATLLLAGVGVIAVAGLTVALDGDQVRSTTAAGAQVAPVTSQVHGDADHQGLGQGQRQGLGQGDGNGNGQGGGNGNGRSQGGGTGGHGSGEQDQSHAADVPAAVPGATISTEVAEVLAFMAEEEKLARDVYTLAKVAYPDARVFANISRSESTHMSEVQVLLERYDVTDPTEGNGPGEFADDALQNLFDDLADRVDDSRDAAVQVGVDVEVRDIADLRQALDLDAPADVTAVLGNLLAGSERHLAAFQRNGGTIDGA
jgi:hypothetical protein